MTFKKIPGFGSQASTFNTDFFGGLEKREFALNAALARKALMTQAAMEGADITNENTIAMGKKAGAAAERAGLVSGLGSLGTSLVGGFMNMGSGGGGGLGDMDAYATDHGISKGHATAIHDGGTFWTTDMPTNSYIPIRPGATSSQIFGTPTTW